MNNYIAALLLAILFPFNVFAQHLQTINGNQRLNDLSPLKNFSVPENACRYLVFSYYRIPSEKETMDLRTKGLELVGFAPPSAYIVRIKNWNESLFSDIKTIFNAYGEVPVSLKLAPELFGLYVNKSAVFPNSVVVSVYDSTEIEKLRSALLQTNINAGQDRYIGNSSLIVRISGFDELHSILELDMVASVQTHHQDVVENYSNTSMQSNQIHIVNYNRNGPIGRNTYFASIEGFGSYTKFRLDTKGRNHPVYGMHRPDIYSSAVTHGNMVGLYAAATGNVDEYESRGMAEGATLIHMPSYSSIETYYTNYNLKPLVLNVSAGPADPTMTYNTQAKEFDRLSRSLKSYILCMAAGNNGNGNNPTLNYGPGWANITLEGATNKNNLAVHAASNPGEHYEWASNGPAKDGRLKPDICTEGRDGTSSASPNMAGYMNVLFESYKDSYNTDVRSDVIKAVALNTAIDLDKKGIDFKTGFGLINPLRAHKTIQEKHIITGSMPQGSAGTSQFQITVPAGLREAKFLLYWHDYPGTVGAGKALVNNLDLKITTPSGQTLMPWVLDPTPGNQYNLPLRKVDTLNNIEQVTLDHPEAGVYTITVTGTAVPFGPQEFVLTYDLLPYHINITSPAPGFKTGFAKRMLFVWNAALDTDNAANQLELILQKETGQSSLIATLPPTRLYYSYIIPSNFPNTSTARLIIRQKNTLYSDTSDYFQLMETPTGLSFRSICPERIALRWNALPAPGVKYIIYRLGEKYMDEVARVDHPATSVQLDASSLLGPGQTFNREEWFAIAALHSNGAVSLRSSPISDKQTTVLSLPLSYSKEYNLCLGDSLIVSAHNLDRDSIRWYRNGMVLPGITVRTIALKASTPGDYYYKVFQQGGCVYIGDTIKISTHLAISDTLKYGDRAWNIYAFKDNDYQKFYGRVVMYPLSINTKLYYDDIAGQIDNMAGYEGCEIGKIYTLIYKRKGFAKGYYTMRLDYNMSGIQLFINGQPVYTSPQNGVNLGIVWQGHLDEESIIRIVHKGNNRTHLGLNIEASDYAVPGGISGGLALWLDGNNMASDTTGPINAWRDSFPYAIKNRTESGAGIHVKATGINYNPVLVFNNDGGVHGKITSGSANQGYTYAVFNMHDNSGNKARIIGFSFPPGGDDAYPLTYTPFCRIDSSGQIGIYKYNTKFASSAKLTGKWNCMLAGFTPGNIFLSSADGLHTQGIPVNSTLYYTAYNIGSRYDSLNGEGRLKGEIAEIIQFTRSLSASEAQKVYSYLALKYGFNFNQPYLNASGREVYRAGGYSFNIAGIARDDRQGLMQKQSFSTEDPGDVVTGSLGPVAASNKLNNAVFGQDSSFVIWGHNGALPVYNIQMTDSSLRLQRTWKLQHTGNAGIFRLNFNDTMVELNSECEEYKLLITKDLADISSYRFLDIMPYRAGDGKQYVFAEINLQENVTFYFSLIRKRKDFVMMALPENSKAARFCVEQNTLTLTDSTQRYAVAHLTTTLPSQTDSILKFSLHTDNSPDVLISCNDSTRIAMINRLLYVSTASDLAGLQLRLFIDGNDSVNAVLNPSGNSCDIFRTPVRWFIEESIDSLRSKVSRAEPLSWIEAGSINYTIDSAFSYVDISGFSLKEFIVGAAIYDTSMKPPLIQSVSSGFNNMILTYPNPFKNELNLINAPPTSIVNVYNMYGQLVTSSRVSESVTTLHLSEAAGVYFVYVNNDNKILFKQKVIKVPE